MSYLLEHFARLCLSLSACVSVQIGVSSCPHLFFMSSCAIVPRSHLSLTFYRNKSVFRTLRPTRPCANDSNCACANARSLPRVPVQCACALHSCQCAKNRRRFVSVVFKAISLMRKKDDEGFFSDVHVYRL